MTEPEVAASPSLEPITERVLRRLGGRRAVWILLWSAVPLLSPLIFSTVIRASGQAFPQEAFVAGVLTQSGLVWACLVLLWGCGNLAAQARSTRDELRRAAPGEIPETIFGAIARRDGPILLTVLVTLIVEANNWLAFGPLAPLATLPVFMAYMVPIMTFVWVYVAILVDINRLGELPVVLDRFPQDRTMGLGRIGSLASTGLGTLFLAAIPILLVGSDEPVTLAISLTLVVGAIASYALSMWRLHRQMAAAKRRYVANARRLYADAYAPIREHPDVGSLTAASTALAVAQSLDERAAGLPTWPIDEGTARFVAVVVTGVITSLIVRALFAAIGF
jgi:hypothetical protein